MADFKIDQEEDGDIRVVSVQGYINVENGSQLVTVFEQLVGEGGKKYVIDFAQTDVINSQGAWCIGEVLDLVEDSGGQVACCNMKPIFLKTFKIMGIDRRVKVAESIGEAKSVL